MNSQTINRFRGIEQQQREDEHAAAIRRSRAGFDRARSWALQVGFSERHAPFAASVASMMKIQKKRQLTKADVPEIEQRMRDQWPFLFEGEP
jgi:hypothetical protein